MSSECLSAKPLEECCRRQFGHYLSTIPLGLQKGSGMLSRSASFRLKPLGSQGPGGRQLGRGCSHQ